ncbi:MAG TPA: YCF48-related protein [Ignavibacteria bacterium]|nr:YCF48-related protein [Ignavibacteria bacterium]
MAFTFRGVCGIALGSFFLFMEETLWGPFFDEKRGDFIATGISVGKNGQIFKTRGNDTINFQPRNSGTNQDLNALAISFELEPYCLAVGNNGTILRSTNLGDNWSTITSPTTNKLNDVCYADLNRDFIVGDGGVILKSTNLGLSWSLMSSGTTRKLNAVSVHAGSLDFVIAVGEKGTILRSTNAGLTFTNTSLVDTSFDFTCINLAEIGNTEFLNFFIGGTNGKIYRSSNLGLNWVAQNSGTTTKLNSILIISDDSGAVVGDNGIVRVTTNGGNTWYSDPFFDGLTGNLTSLSLMPRPSKTITALSKDGTTGFSRIGVASDDSIRITTSVKQINSTIPSSFNLHQNYPNPFNPKTKIKFDIQSSGIIKLNIFDITGKEIALVVNSFLTPGEYETNWDAGNISGGIYFYKLTFTSGNLESHFSETRKMILVK